MLEGEPRKIGGPVRYRKCDRVKVQGGVGRKLTDAELEWWHARMQRAMRAEPVRSILIDDGPTTGGLAKMVLSRLAAIERRLEERE